MHVSLNSLDEKEELEFEITRLKLRIDNLEHIVHELLRDRLPKEFADAWLELTGTAYAENNSFKGRGEHIAHLVDQFQKGKAAWPPKDSLK
jgi:hypothetical protein